MTFETMPWTPVLRGGRGRAKIDPAGGVACGSLAITGRAENCRMSYDNDTTKGAREEGVPIAAALVSYLEDAIDASKGNAALPARRRRDAHGG